MRLVEITFRNEQDVDTKVWRSEDGSLRCATSFLSADGRTVKWAASDYPHSEGGLARTFGITASASPAEIKRIEKILQMLDRS